MVNIFRGAILVALISTTVALFLSTKPVSVTLPLPQAGDPVTIEQGATLVGLLAVPFGLGALLLTVVAAVGLLRFRAWARPLAVWSTGLAAGCLLASLWLSPVPIANALSIGHAMLLVASALAWAVALVLLRSASVRKRFSGR